MDRQSQSPVRRRRGFTLVELLVVVAVVGLLMSILLPVMAKAKIRARGVRCLNNYRTLAQGWTMFADDNNDVMLPGKFASEPGGYSNPKNWYPVGNGMKFRPPWAAYMGAYVGAFAFNKPRTDTDRQDFDNEVYINPLRADWKDERNYSFGYNHQFLGNARRSKSGVFYNYPARRGRLSNFAETVMGATSIGTAAGFAQAQRTPYENDGKKYTSDANHAWSLDPPRLTSRSDRGSGDADSPRTAVDDCFEGRAIAAFLDGHVEARTAESLGYRQLSGGKFVDLEKVPNLPHNQYFSGTGRDDAPPAKPQ